MLKFLSKRSNLNFESIQHKLKLGSVGKDKRLPKKNDSSKKLSTV